MGELLRLIAGDKRNPTRTLTIAGSTSAANIFLRSGGFSPGPGPKKVYWSGQTPRQDGQKRLGSSRDNSKQVITYDLVGGSAAELGYLQREITRFFEDAGLYEEEKTSTPCWLEYRWHDNLDDVPAPTFGQFSYYIKILDGGPPQWPKQLHNTGVLTSGNIEEVMCELVCEPHWEGLEQKVGIGDDRLDMTKDGVFIGVSVTNLITNPSFGHSTWDTGWTSSTGGFDVDQETRPGYTRSLNSAAHAYNRVGTAQYTQTATLTAATYAISCSARRPDGAALTSADFQMWGQGAAQTTTFVSVGSGWYFCYATFTGVAASSTHGIQVKAGREVIFDDVQLALGNSIFGNYPTPFCAGHLLGCTWAGGPHASTSTTIGGSIQWPFTGELAGGHTLAMWFTPYWETITTGYLFEYKLSATNLFSVTFASGANFVTTLTSTIGGVTVTGTSTKAATFPDYGVPIHFALVQATTTLKLYINGVEEISIAVTAASAPDGTFSLGKDADKAVSSINGAFDGLHLWDRSYSATQASTLYANELEIKSAGGLIGMPPFFWTKDGDNILDNVNDTNRDNSGVLAGVVGDVEALTEWRIQLPTSTPSRVLWLGRKATDTNFDAAILFTDLQGTVDAGSSGGEYQEVTTAGTSTGLSGTYTQLLANLRGRYQWLARMYVATNSITMNPRWHWGATGEESKVNGDGVTIATNANLLLRDIGELSLYWDDRQEVPNTITMALRFTPTTGTSTVRGDFFQLLPWPWCRVGALDSSITIVAGDLLIISDTVAYVKEADNSHKYTFEHRGAAVNVLPGKYNTIYMLQGEEGTQYDIADTGTFTIYITPRWLLPGGAVA